MPFYASNTPIFYSPNDNLAIIRESAMFLIHQSGRGLTLLGLLWLEQGLNGL